MTPLRRWFNDCLREVAPKYEGSILNVGSGDDTDGARLHYRDYFTAATEYKTLDPDVPADYKCIVQALSDHGPFDTVLNFWVLEHIWDFKRFIGDLYETSKNNLIMAVPTKYPYHPAPNDYWRFTREAMERLFEYSFKIKRIQIHEDAKCGGIFIEAVKI